MRQDKPHAPEARCPGAGLPLAPLLDMLEGWSGRPRPTDTRATDTRATDTRAADTRAAAREPTPRREA